MMWRGGVHRPKPWNARRLPDARRVGRANPGALTGIWRGHYGLSVTLSRMGIGPARGGIGRWFFLALAWVFLGTGDPAGTRVAAAAPDGEGAGWIELFNGRDLEGWRANEKPGSFRVEAGAILCDGPRSHLFYVGPVAGAVFRDFEFEAEVKAMAGANSGVYFHTAWQEKDWLAKGYEVQVNHTATGEGGYRENKKTGSLYGIRNVYRQLVPDGEWFTLRIVVLGKRVTVEVNGIQTVDYTEPAEPPDGGYRERRLDQGTFALQCHDPGSRVAFRRIRVRPRPAAERVPDPMPGADAGLLRLYSDNVPVVDLHTHLKGGLTLADVVQRQFRTGINAGVAVNCGLGFSVTNDAGLERALAELRTEPRVFVGMQAEGREWVRLFSRKAMAGFDYVFTDAMTFSNREGKRMRLWIPEEVEVGDPQAFMDLLVERTVGILEGEPIDVWVNPTFLPAVLARDAAALWTPERIGRVIEAAVRHGVAIELNDRFQLPSESFVRKAKAAGAKFTFGTNNGGRSDLGTLSYSVRTATACGLSWQDFWVPGWAPSRVSREAP